MGGPAGAPFVPARPCGGCVAGVDGKGCADGLAGICTEKWCCGVSMPEDTHVDNDDNWGGPLQW